MEGQGHLPLPVRMGVHTGTAEERAGNYFGRTLNRTARMMSAGHGGQILVSDATAVLVGDEVPLVDLGLHRLAGLPRWVRVWQVGSKHFPVLRTLGVVAGTLPEALDAEVRIAVEESLGDKSQSLIDTGRSMSIDDIVALVCSELASITT